METLFLFRLKALSVARVTDVRPASVAIDQHNLFSAVFCQLHATKSKQNRKHFGKGQGISAIGDQFQTNPHLDGTPWNMLSAKPDKQRPSKARSRGWWFPQQQVRGVEENKAVPSASFLTDTPRSVPQNTNSKTTCLAEANKPGHLLQIVFSLFQI